MKSSIIDPYNSKQPKFFRLIWIGFKPLIIGSVGFLFFTNQLEWVGSNFGSIWTKPTCHEPIFFNSKAHTICLNSNKRLIPLI